ncbi:uncharacterized protein LOC17883060 [Capsella rubella]|nr:uncharacterized protein LOC17883060 [Capsella rubella]
MKSEGRHHQSVVSRTGTIHPHGFNPRPTNRFNSPPDQPTKSKVPSEVTNHHSNISERSKYSNCHVSPAMKSGHKSKGRRKLQPNNWWSEDNKLDRLIGSDSSSARDVLDTLYDVEDHDEHY